MIDDKQISDWVAKYSFNYIRKRLGVSSKQAELICAGEIEPFRELISLAILSEPKPAAHFLLDIEAYLGISRAHCALIIGLSVDKYKKVVDGEVVDCTLWRYLEVMSNNKKLLAEITKQARTG